ncbi:alpha/beta fold hydrolase [Cellulomonas shaoxiangyii]|uniref:Alpha/beta hydrolase n=1 Tax=Cellulomonas shaoxiangyii TaxID=2566013 RepID=A0A4P7SL87_9CELL|nr:alpha/beta hydrolase [Cellulomonas shaoxiangyii]QCB94982.1 alpha/beta hydrolase [Cellulomonas shaoxiangyii]TGY77252.1 alpha/beta hydrolase [Cellulomonas shaoxiangyii]
MRETQFWGGLAAVAVATGALAAAGAAAEAVGTRRDRRRYPPPGRFVDADGVRLHVEERGAGLPGPTVVLENGMACPLEIWSWVQDAVGADAPVVAYDRAGLGRSSPSPRPRTAASSVAELRAALAAAGHAPPYVLVAHSYGGLLARHFASAHPDEVAGLVLADVSHPDQLTRSPRQQLGLTGVEQHLRDAELRAAVGLLRRTATAERLNLAGLPPERAASGVAASRARRTWTAAIAEFEAWTRLVNDEVRTSVLRRDVPVCVLVAERTLTEDPVHLVLQREIAALSDDHDVRVVAGADHFSLLTDAQHAAAVVGAVRDVLAAVRTGRPLASPPEPPGAEGPAVTPAPVAVGVAEEVAR